MKKDNRFLPAFARNSLTAIGLSSLVAFGAAADPFTYNVENDVYSNAVNGIATANYNNDTAPDLYNAANSLLGTNYTGNEALDSRLLREDQLFIGDGNNSVMMVGLAAANVNSLGIYTDRGVGQQRQELISNQTGFFEVSADGSQSNPFGGSVVEIHGQFGFYLESDQHDANVTNTFFSESDLNTIDSGLDHMMAFSMDELNGQTYWIDDGTGATEYTFENAMLIGWEDLPLSHGSYDDDYDDIMYLVDFKRSVPAPATFMLFGLMLLLPLLKRKA